MPWSLATFPSAIEEGDGFAPVQAAGHPTPPTMPQSHPGSLTLTVPGFLIPGFASWGFPATISRGTVGSLRASDWEGLRDAGQCRLQGLAVPWQWTRGGPASVLTSPPGSRSEAPPPCWQEVGGLASIWRWSWRLWEREGPAERAAPSPGSMVTSLSGPPTVRAAGEAQTVPGGGEPLTVGAASLRPAAPAPVTRAWGGRGWAWGSEGSVRGLSGD